MIPLAVLSVIACLGSSCVVLEREVTLSDCLWRKAAIVQTMLPEGYAARDVACRRLS